MLNNISQIIYFDCDRVASGKASPYARVLACFQRRSLSNHHDENASKLGMCVHDFFFFGKMIVGCGGCFLYVKFYFLFFIFLVN